MKYWEQARELVARTPSLSMATTDEDGTPRVTPIGSLFLTDEGQGFYFEKLPRGLRKNLDRDGRFALLAVRGGLLFWLKGLVSGRFRKFPALSMKGRAHKCRPCTPEERKQFDSRFGRFKGTRGYNVLWKDMHTVREITIDTIEPANLASLTKGLL